MANSPNRNIQQVVEDYYQPGTPDFFSVEIPSPALAFPQELRTTLTDMPFVHLNIVDPVASAPRSQYALGLPMPSSVRVAYNSSWEEVDLGWLGGAAYNAMDLALNRGASISEAMREAGKQSIFEGAGRALGNALEATGTMAKAAVEKAGRIMVNNHAALLFKGMAMREFQMEFMLFPKNERDSQEIFDIIFQLKYAMHPDVLGVGGDGSAMMSQYFLYPSNFIIGFYAPKLLWLFRTSPCALTHLEVEYQPLGVPAYFNTTSEPVAVQLILNFKENEVLTKDRIEQGW